MNAKLFVTKSTLKVLIFLDFLEDLPQKTVKYVIKISVLLVIIIFFLSLLAVEMKNEALSNLFVYVFVPKSRGSSAVVNRYPVLVNKLRFPNVGAKSIIVADLNNSKILYEKNSDDPLPPASTTKLMTAVIASENFELSDFVTVPEVCTELDTQKVGFAANEIVRVRDLIYGLLIGSAGDSACALAYGSDSYGKFIGQMNKKALELGAENTNFVNPVGLDDINDQHHSSAADLYIIAKYAISKPEVKDAVSTKEYNINSGAVRRKVFNTNDLLWGVDGTVGVKTGRTQGAGEVLVYQYSKDDANLMIIVMGSEDRFEDTKKILEWALNSFDFGPGVQNVSIG